MPLCIRISRPFSSRTDLIQHSLLQYFNYYKNATDILLLTI